MSTYTITGAASLPKVLGVFIENDEPTMLTVILFALLALSVIGSVISIFFLSGTSLFGLIIEFFVSIFSPGKAKRDISQDYPPYQSMSQGITTPPQPNGWLCSCGIYNSLKAQKCRSCGKPANYAEPPKPAVPPFINPVKVITPPVSANVPQAQADELLKQYQEMYRSGLISKEEFEEKKRQINDR